MKKFLSLVSLLLVFLAAGCKDDENVNSKVLSTLRFNDKPLMSKTNQYTYTTSALLDSDGKNYIRGFNIVNKNNPEERFGIAITYPVTKSNASGSYNFGLGGANELFAQGTFTLPNNENYVFVGYNVNVNDLGNGRYNLSFADVQAIIPFTNGNFSIVSGYIETEFTDIQQ